MTKKQRQISDVADQALRDQIDAFDQRIQADEEAHRQKAAQIKLEREAADLDSYASQRISAAITTGKVSPSFRSLLSASTYTSYAAVDSAISAAIAATMEMAPATAPATVSAQPRDETTGQFLPQAQEPQQEQPQEIDWENMTTAEYAALRGQLGIQDHGEDNLSNRPGYTKASGAGMFDGLPGYQDPRTSNRRVFDSTLEDTRRNIPPGYLRG